MAAIDLLYDCDLTMGLPGRDVDDGLALLYLLGSPGVRLAGITSTFGNSTLEEVQACLRSTLGTLGVSGLPVHRGASASDAQRGDRDSPAAHFLAEMVQSAPGRFSLLATGSLTNLLGAALLQPDFFGGLRQIVVMGGTTEPLLLGERRMRELNFSADPQAARAVLHSGARVAAITGNLCLQLLLEPGRLGGLLERMRAGGSGAFADYLAGTLDPWFQRMQSEYGLAGFHPWDAIAALYLTHPQLFDDRRWAVEAAPEDLASGLLRPKAAGPLVAVPARVLDPEACWRVLLEAWARFAPRFPPRPGPSTR